MEPTTYGDGLYKTLRFYDSLRVLELQPGRPEDPLVCKLVETRLSSGCSYEALSYVWAQYLGPAFLECNGHRVSTTCNVEYALRHLRSGADVRSLWIDQLCINQVDLLERSQQVDNMYKIFTKAKRVLIWLGKEDIFPVWATHAIKQVDILPSRQSLIGRSDDTPTLVEEVGSFPLEVTMDTLIGVAALRTLPYFKRVWTVQEAYAAIRQGLIICGREYTEFRKMLRLLEHVSPQMMQAPPYVDSGILDFSHQSTLGNVYVISALVEMEHDSQPAKTSIFLLDTTRSCTATDDRDRIYSIYHFLPSGIRKALGPPDYTATTQDLFHRLAGAEIDVGNGRNCVGAAGSSYQNLDLPSWVPDWTFGYPAGSVCLSTIDTSVWNQQGKPKIFAAATSVQGFFQLSDRMRRRHLSVTAHLVDIVHLKSHILDFELRETEINAHWFTKTKQNLTACFEIAEQSQSHRHDSSITRHKICGSTLAASLFATWLVNKLHIVRATGDAFSQGFERFEHALGLYPPEEWGYLLENSGLMGEETLDELGNIDRYRYILQLIPHGRRFFATSTGYLGIGPPGMQEGDILAVIHGCVTPSVVRKCEDGKYTLVGECYAHGLMDGEALELETAPACSITLR